MNKKKLSPMKRAKRIRIFSIILLLLFVTVITVTIAAYKKYSIDRSDDTYYIADYIHIDGENTYKLNVNDELIQATIISADTIFYKVSDNDDTVSDASIIISLVDENVSAEEVDSVTRYISGADKNDNIYTYQFENNSIWCNINGYQCNVARQKIITGYYRSDKGHLYSITFSAKESDFTKIFKTFLIFSSKVTFEN